MKVVSLSFALHYYPNYYKNQIEIIPALFLLSNFYPLWLGIGLVIFKFVIEDINPYL